MEVARRYQAWRSPRPQAVRLPLGSEGNYSFPQRMLTELGKLINPLRNTMLQVNTQKDSSNWSHVSLTHRHTLSWFWELAQETQCRPPLAWWAAHWSRTLYPGRGARFCNSWNPPAAGRSSSHSRCSTPPLGRQWAHPRWWSWRWVESKGRLLPRRQAEVERWERGALEGKSESFQTRCPSVLNQVNVHQLLK